MITSLLCKIFNWLAFAWRSYYFLWLELHHYMFNNCHSTIGNCNQIWFGGVRYHSTCGWCCLWHILPRLCVEFSPPGSVRCPLLGQSVMLGWAREWGSSDWSQADEWGSPDWSWAWVWVWVTIIICPWWAIYTLGEYPLGKFPNHPPSSTLGSRRYVYALVGSGMLTHGY